MPDKPRYPPLYDLTADERAELLDELWRVIQTDDDAKAAMIDAALSNECKRLETLLAEMENT